MKYSEFREVIFKNVKEALGDSYNVELKCNLKNNNKKNWAIIISKEQESVVPSIRLEFFYKSFMNNEYSLGEVVEEVIDIYNSHKGQMSIDEVLDRDNVLQNTYCKLINKKLNDNLLKDIPYYEFLDLAVVFYVMVSDDIEFCQTITINNNVLSMLDIKKDELYRIAVENTFKNQSINCMRMQDIIKELLPEEKIDEEPQIDMYVLTNEKKYQGAIYMMDMEVMEKLSNQLNSDLIILPSSIHEVIIIPYTDDVSVEYCKSMVSEINCTEVSCEEILSDSVYIYKRDCERIEVCD